mmetsp:Transcript_1657/g.4384  ORF Transcript_1657/g.4384 Transcript_1657/m.4384 type:complete len:313 (+) Transcript_1657:22-960(+)
MSLHAVRDASALAIVGGGIFRESGGEYFNDLWLLHLQCTPRLPSPQPEGLFALASKGVSAGASAIVVPRAEGEVHFTALHSTSSTASREGDFAPGCAEKGGDTCTPPCADVSLKGDVFLKGDVLFELECGERVHAHAALLAEKSPYFRALLQGGFGEAAHVLREGAEGVGQVPVRVRGVSALAFRSALHYFYSGALPCECEGWSALLPELLCASEMWLCYELHAAVEAQLGSLLLLGELSAADVEALGSERLSTLASELRAIELLFAPPGSHHNYFNNGGASGGGEVGGDGDARLRLERRLRRKGFVRVGDS